MYRHHLYILYILVIFLATALVLLYILKTDDRVKETLYSEIASTEDTLDEALDFVDIFTDIIAEKDSVLKVHPRNSSQDEQISFRLVDSISGEVISKEKTASSDELIELFPDIKKGRKFDLQYKTDTDEEITLSRITYEYKI